MLSKCRTRTKDGKNHAYYSVCESLRVRCDQVIQCHVLHLGELNTAYIEAWQHSIDVLHEDGQRRPFIYQTNVLHRNSLKGWKWASDVFGVLLIFLTVSGWFMLRGKCGLGGRGKWLIVAGMLPPIIAIIVFELVQK